MPKQPNLSRLSPRDECLARIALANMPRHRPGLRLGAVVDLSEGTAIIVAPDGSGEKKSGLICGSRSSNGLEVTEQDV